MNQAQKHDATLAELALCLRLCNQCAAECIDQGTASLARCIKLCLLCADTCGLCIRATTSGLEKGKEVCRLCAQICEDCAVECEKGQSDLMQRCAQACRQMAA